MLFAVKVEFKGYKATRSITMDTQIWLKGAGLDIPLIVGGLGGLGSTVDIFPGFSRLEGGVWGVEGTKPIDPRPRAVSLSS